MITHSLLNKTKTVTGFNRFSKFIALGNNIDGFVNIGHEEFENWEDFTNRFPEIYRNIRFAGEWSLNIYQVPDDYRIKYQYGYFMVPKKGKMIADIGYMQIAGKHMDVFISNAIIHFSSKTIYYTKNKPNPDLDQEATEITEEFLTILLHEELDRKSFNDIDYPGDARRVHHETYSYLRY